MRVKGEGWRVEGGSEGEGEVSGLSRGRPTLTLCQSGLQHPPRTIMVREG